MLSVKQEDIKHHFLSLWYDSTGIESRFPGPLANTLPTRPINVDLKTEDKTILKELQNM